MAIAQEKYTRLRELLAGYGRSIIAYSGGVDSAFLLRAAVEVLGDRVLAVTADSPSIPRSELREAEAFARDMGARHLVIATAEMNDPNYTSNPANRCYFCKSELYTRLGEVVKEQDFDRVLNGINADDVGDYRPGIQAARDFEVASPLLEAGLHKAEIRELARDMGLPFADKPAMACLSSRIPYGEAVTPEKLAMIEAAEACLKELGLGQLRVRHHEGKLARIEVDPDQLPALAEPATRERIVSGLKQAGYLYVTLDLQGYRMGSLNEALKVVGRS